MNKFKSLLISFVLIALFSYSLLNFGFGIQDANNVNQTILDDGSLSQLNDSIRTSLSDFESSQQAQLNATNSEQSEEIQPAGDLSLGSIFHSITTFGGFIFGMGEALFSPALLGRIGIDNVFAGMMIAILSVVLVLVVWRLLKTGE